jgi:hypothetical protein
MISSDAIQSREMRAYSTIQSFLCLVFLTFRLHGSADLLVTSVLASLGLTLVLHDNDLVVDGTTAV